MPTNEMNNVTDRFPVRTVETYKEAVQQLTLSLKDTEAANVKGLKFDSVFNSLEYFHVCQPGLPPCIGHDLFEGVVAYNRYFVKLNKNGSHTHS